MVLVSSFISQSVIVPRISKVYLSKGNWKKEETVSVRGSRILLKSDLFWDRV